MISALCVDDEQELLDLYKFFLEQSGEIQVDTADSVKMAVGKLKKFRYDIIISDYSMPEYDGVAFLKCILPTYGDIPFILFTGKGREEVVIDALNNGARFYIQKGGDPKEKFDDLIHKIKYAVGLKKVEDALRDSEIRYRNLFETANYGILLLDAETGGIIDANLSLLTLIGSSLEEILGKHLWDIGIFKDADLGKKAFLELQTKKNTRFESLPLLTKNGQEIVVEFVSNVYTVDQVDVIQCNIRDITERKQAEEIRRVSEARFTELFDTVSSGVAIYEVKNDGLSGKDYIIKDFSNAALALEGRKKEEVVGKSLFDLRPAIDDYGLIPIFRGVWKTGEPAYYPAKVYVDENFANYYENRIFRLPEGEIVAIYNDVTEQKRAEEALRESEETFKALAENANDGILVCVAGGIHAYANRRAGEITGYSVAELLKTSIKDLAAPDEIENLIERFRKRLSGEDVPHQYETIIICKDGKSVPIELTGAKTVWHGQPADLIIIRDITERKRADEALQQSETKYRTLVETLNEGIWVIDREAVTTFVNPKMAEILGYTIEEMAGRSLFSFMDDEGKRICEHLIERRQQGIKEQLTFEFLKKDGTRIYVSLETGPITGKDGEYLGAIAGVTDITDRKRMEEALRKSELDLREAQRVSHVGSWDLNVVTGHLQWSDECYRIYGFRPQEFVPTYEKFRSIVHPEDLGFVQEQVDAALNNDKHYNIDFRFVRPDGVNGWIHCEGEVTRDAEGKPLRFFGTQIDITDRKRAEEQLKHFNEELESQVRSRTVELERINTLLANEAIQRTQAEESMRKSLKERELLLREVHHRVRNNLQIMLSLIRLQSRNIKDPSLLDPMGEFQNRIKAMAHVHERMYRTEDISRIDLSEIVTSLGKSLFKSYKVDPQHIRLNVEMKDLQITIESAIPLSLIINELISNSIKHAFPKGTTGEITIAGRREADTLVLSIRDTGIGIPEDLDWMRSKQSIGHRLVAILVEQLNGTIELDRTTGTAFNIVVKEKP